MLLATTCALGPCLSPWAESAPPGSKGSNAVLLSTTAGSVPPGGILPIHVELSGGGLPPDTLVLKLNFNTSLLRAVDVAPGSAGGKLVALNATENGLVLVAFGGDAAPSPGRLATLYLEVEAAAALGLELTVADGGSSASDSSARALAVSLTAASVHIAPLALRHASDSNANGRLELGELLRAVQLYNLGGLYCDDGSEDGYSGEEGDRNCAPHNLDYAPQDWRISLSELLRAIQFYNAFKQAYHEESGGEDGFAPGPRD